MFPLTSTLSQCDITHDDLAQILAENKTPVKQKQQQPKRSGADGANPSPATSQEICAFVEAATRGGRNGMALALEEEYGGMEKPEMEIENKVGNGTAFTCVRMAVDPTLLGALDVTLRHHSFVNPILTLRDIGRLASCSKSISDMVAEAPIWQQLFERAAKSGRPYGTLTGRAATLARHYKASTVCGENRLLSCFTRPSPTVISAVGYKKAASCLLSKACAKCGALCALANPITFTRTCTACALSDPSSYLIHKTNAKLFLLSDSELYQLRGATYEKKGKGKAKECSSTLYLLSEVMEASYKKYIGADGLAAEIAKRRTAALERYERSQSTTKPQKKRPRIERLSDRPGDDARRIFFAEGGLPIGTCVDLERCTMHPAVWCRYCRAMGSVEDIVLHEKLVHR